MTTGGDDRTGKRIRDVLREDVRKGGFMAAFRREMRDLKESVLSEEQNASLVRAGTLQRFFLTTWWLFKGFFLQLTPIRRLLLILGFVIIAAGPSGTGDASNNHIGGAFILLIVLMFELKDRVTAQRELAGGQAVQRRLMPEPGPRVPGWDIWLFTKPANEVGGDIVDFVPMGEGRFGLAIGDVTGKGLSAALLGAKLQATLRAAADDAHTLADLAGRMNRIFCRDGLPGFFASFVYVELSSGSPVIDFVNAGHIPPLVLRAGSVERTAKGGAALGMIPGATYVPERVTLEVGDCLVAYSDGVTEARNEQGEFFGDERLLRLLPALCGLGAAEMGEQITRAVDAFLGEARRTDDLTIVIARRIQA